MPSDRHSLLATTSNPSGFGSSSGPQAESPWDPGRPNLGSAAWPAEIDSGHNGTAIERRVVRDTEGYSIAKPAEGWRLGAMSGFDARRWRVPGLHEGHRGRQRLIEGSAVALRAR
jgi:hypothetical protein